MSFFHSPNIFISSYQLIIELSLMSTAYNIHFIHRFWIKQESYEPKKIDFLIWIGQMSYIFLNNAENIERLIFIGDLEKNLYYIIGIILSENVSMILIF